MNTIDNEKSTVIPASQVQLKMRWMLPPDLPSVLYIENLCFDFPWSKSDLEKVLGEKFVIGIVLAASDIASKSEVIIGYVIYEMKRGVIDILNIAVVPSCQRRGYGSMLVRKLKEKFSHTREKSGTISVHVREKNLEGQLFFKANGFRATKIQEIVFEHDGHVEDTYVMELSV